MGQATKQKETVQPTRRDIHQEVTNVIIKQLEEGTIPWRKPWNSAVNINFNIPVNFTTGTYYRGINTVLLWNAAMTRNYSSNAWATFKQWSENGESICKGEKSSMIVYYNMLEVEEDEKVKKIPFLKAYNVFNRCQLESYTPEETPEPTLSLVQRVEHVEEFIRNTDVDIRINGDRACYVPATDRIYMPNPSDFIETEECTATEAFYSVLAHELTHWTGHSLRLDRDLRHKFGKPEYAEEELVAELGAAFFCAEMGISNKPKQNHASYIESWLKVLKNNKYAITKAASAASKAMDFLQAFQPSLNS